MQNSSKQTPPSKIDRYRRVLGVLGRHGLGIAGADRAEHLREACEELGTTFIKLGQMLSTRADLLPESVRAELAKLQEHVPECDYAQIESVVVEELGASPELLFASFDRTPLASASIGQAYLARLGDGRSIVVKVQKPHVRAEVDADLQILRDIASTWSTRIPELKEFDVERLVEDFATSLQDELDYRKEAANVRTFREIFATDPAYDLPQTVDEWCTRRVLTLTRVPSAQPQTISTPPSEQIARAIGRFVLEPAFEHGIFYADPHPGNLFAGPDGRVCVVDFGMVARLTPDARRKVADVFVAIDRRDPQRLADRIVDLTAPSRPVDRSALTADVARMLERYVDAAAENIDFEQAISALLEIVRAYRLRLPGNLAQLFKALMMCEARIEAIDPQARLSDYLEPIVSKALYQRLTGQDWRERLQDSAVDAAELSIELPRRLDRVLGEVERGNLRVYTRLEDVDALVTRFQKTVERANATMLAAACIVAMAIVMTIYHPQGWQNWIGVVFWVAVVAVLIHVVRTLLALRR